MLAGPQHTGQPVGRRPTHDDGSATVHTALQHLKPDATISVSPNPGE